MVDRLTPVEVATLLREEPMAVLLLDVREQDERATACIEPSVHIPMHQVPSRTAELPKDRQLIVYCHHGTRSEMIAGYLSTHGFAKVANLVGGIDAWSKTVDSNVPRY